MNEAAPAVAENKDHIQQKSVEYPGGTITYTVFGNPSAEAQKIYVIPGFTEDSLTMEGFARVLSENGRHQIIVSDQPHHRFGKGIRVPAINDHAEANLAVIHAEGLDNEPLAVVAHSLGAPILVRMAELAKDRDITALDQEKGSKSVFLAPAGANQDERLLLSRDALAVRFLRDFLLRDAKENKKFDPTKRGQTRAAKNFVRNPLKTAKEAWHLSKKETTYQGLGKIGLEPFVLEFPDDVLQPHKLNRKTMDRYLDGSDEGGLNLSGWSMAVNISGVGTGDKTAKDAWLDDYRRGGHNDHARHPQHVARVVLDLFERQL